MAVEQSITSSIREPSESSSATGETRIPLTDAQQEIWLAASLSHDQSASFNLSQCLDIRGSLDVEVMRNSLQALVNQHDALRITRETTSARSCVRCIEPLEISKPQAAAAFSPSAKLLSGLGSDEVIGINRL